ncbi:MULTISPECIES: Hsp33 family molecular chaperone HslO [unclassified Neptuniibacter]|jgi:molecular chaperone Hsp33|uniref:Hsp33 family molecular chaperone HslO n=1 Tax=unclassified Neptuniibacter TaxID=2630693 RepID=UPI0026E3D021|nr:MULTISPECIES: Hsp33 family molecular chaperone HslO [unclassified Neptuniibacter]MDO6514900.1 Hsp33 family molecular chaperone HslO [Neptuniibacter sp. 2_MG-2023]MDO6594522.1 Hsp33 family molecular chaperone HslO [Neptuniibacter sp. 1_MG-2023]
MSNPDQIQRIMFDELDIRGVVSGLKKTCSDCFENHNYPPVIKQVLGEMLAAVSLLSSNLKFEGRLILQAQGQGNVRLLMAETNQHRDVRAIARLEGDVPDNATFTELLPQGQVVLTIEPENGQRYQGVVPLDGENLAKCLESYFVSSEQLPTYVQLASDGETAAGLMLQVLPAEGSGQDDWERISFLASTLKSIELLELDNETLLYRLFHEETCRLYEPDSVQFKCTCSRERSLSSLKLVGKADLLSLIEEEGCIDVSCQFCNHHYIFDQTDVEALFSEAGTTDNSQNVH